MRDEMTKWTEGLAADLADRAYEPGQTYSLRTFQDLFALYCWLPDDRAALLMEEVSSGLRLSAASIKMVSVVGGFIGATVAAGESLDWTDDNKGEGAVNFNTENGENLLSFNYQRAQGSSNVG